MNLGLIRQKTEEIGVLRNALLSTYVVYGGGMRLLRRRRKAWLVLSQVHRTTRSRFLRRILEPFLIRNLELTWSRAGDREGRVAKQLGRRVLVLKPKVSEREKGVVLVKFSETISALGREVDVPRLLADYWLVLEPSWSGYCDSDLMYYTQFRDPVFVMAAEEEDFRFLGALRSNLVPMPFGPSDWVDPDLPVKHLGRPKKYDIVFNSNWKRLKRHDLLFSVLARLDEKLRVALIGGSVDERTIHDVRRAAERYGVLDQLEFFEHIPYDEVMRINCESRLAVLLSLKEGSNRAIPESLFCDVPAIVLAEHVGGVRKNIVRETGRLVPQRQLTRAIPSMLREIDQFAPRRWAVDNISCHATSAALNRIVRDRAVALGQEWTLDLAPKANSPELRIADPDLRERLEPLHRTLASYLLPGGGA